MGGLMLPSSSRVSPITYHSLVAVRYPDLCRLMRNRWELGSFASGGEELVDPQDISSFFGTLFFFRPTPSWLPPGRSPSFYLPETNW